MHENTLEALKSHERSESCSNSSVEIDSQCFQINKTQEEACQEFVFDLDLIYDTISIENNLVCNRKWVNKFITTLTMIGLVIGPTFSGKEKFSKSHKSNLKKEVFLIKLAGRFALSSFLSSLLVSP